jgi:L,D-transpeptidase YnhG
MLLKPVCALFCACLLGTALAATHAKASAKPKPAAPQAAAPARQDGLAEARLIEIYRLIGRSDTRAALDQAQKLVNDYPHFALAQLVYGDLLSARTRPITSFGDVPANQLQAHAAGLAALRDESAARLKALKERPPKGYVPQEFVQLSPNSKHAIAVDAAHSRLYLFENRATGLTLIDDYYISVGKLGVGKSTEGDQRTPLGVYFITSQLDPKSLKDFYGAGALPINYPNILDMRRGKNGGGIWLHGTPSNQFSRPPLATDGCVVLANPDLQHVIQTVAIRTTPVVITNQITWVPQDKASSQLDTFKARLNAWRQAKSSGNLAELNAFYANDFNSGGKTRADWLPILAREVAQARGRDLQIKDLSLLHWQDKEETMVVTFGEVAMGQRTGDSKRQYWARRSGQWTIIYEGGRL